MNLYNNLILIKGEDKTRQISSCGYSKGKYQIIFGSSPKVFDYNYLNVKWYRNPVSINLNSVKISRKGIVFFDIVQILQFENYWRIFFKNGEAKSYDMCELNVEENTLTKQQANNCFEYFKQIADKISIKTQDGKLILSEQYKKINFISTDSALADFLNPSSMQKTRDNLMTVPVYFPFGCNLSQMQAVSKALSNKASVIEGPPGTGKTQTILNIIANAVMNNKTVAVVSNNNSATDNVFEKLEKYGFEFIAAQLGNSDNKKNFIEHNQTEYPDFNSLKYDVSDMENIKQEILDLEKELEDMLSSQNIIADLKRKLSAIRVEKQYFNEYYKETYNQKLKIKNLIKLKSAQMLNLWIECQMFSEHEREISLWFKLKSIFNYGILDLSFFKIPIAELIPAFQNLYYQLKIQELESEIEDINKKLMKYHFNDKLSELTNKSTLVLKQSLYEKYHVKSERKVFCQDDLWKNSSAFNEEYPVILSTTYAIKSSLNKDHIYDYLIIDESSQVDLITGVLALSCSRNIVVVGDLMQLPNVITENTKKIVEPISQSYDIDKGYRYENNSLLSSICSILPNIPRTLLREHYRCHPKIIEFCNQKFYQNQLVVMTEDQHEADVLKVYKTVEGNHARGHLNQRQIDEIKETVIPELKKGRLNADIGIIAPYRKQTTALQSEIANSLDISTVHKFQGREKDDIIISTVDNEITEFTDNPNMLNVAVSRAKNRLRLVVSDQINNENTNIGDLIKYIQYNNFEVVKGEIYSVFDLLYKDYTEKRRNYLEKHKRVSQFDSENIMYALVQEVLNYDDFKIMSAVVHQSLNMLIRDPKNLTDEEYQYAMNSATHLDFLLYNKLNKLPILAIEVDGYKYHRQGTRQAERDQVKDKILEKYNIPLLRFKTNGSQEKQILIEKLRQLISSQ